MEVHAPAPPVRSLPPDVWSLITGMIAKDLKENKGLDGLGDMACVSRDFRDIVYKKRRFMSASGAHSTLVFPRENLKVSLDDEGLSVEETTGGTERTSFGHLGVFSRRVSSIASIRVSHWPDSSGVQPQDHCGLEIMALNSPCLKAVVLISIRKLKRVLENMQRPWNLSNITFDFLADNHVVMDALRSEEPAVTSRLIDVCTYLPDPLGPDGGFCDTRVVWWQNNRVNEYLLRNSVGNNHVRILDPVRTMQMPGSVSECLEVMGIMQVKTGFEPVTWVGWHCLYVGEQRCLFCGSYSIAINGRSSFDNFMIEEFDDSRVSAHLMLSLRMHNIFYFISYDLELDLIANGVDILQLNTIPNFCHVLIVTEASDGREDHHLCMGMQRWYPPHFLDLPGTLRVKVEIPPLVVGLENLREDSHVTLWNPFGWKHRELCTRQGKIYFP